MIINMDKPAERWAEGFPLGNGFFGAMVYGGIDVETVDLSAAGWFSGNADWNNNCPDNAAEAFAGMREAAVREDYATVRALTKNYMGSRLNYGTNLPLAQLVIKHKLPAPSGSPINYNRNLDLKTGLCHVEWMDKQNDYILTRDCFTSHADRVLVMHVKDPAGLSMSFSLLGQNIEFASFKSKDEHGQDKIVCDLTVQAKARENMHSNGTTGTDGQIHLRVISNNGQVQHEEGSCNFRLDGSNDCLLLMTCATDFEAATDQQSGYCSQLIEQASRLGWNELLRRHLDDFSPAMRRVDLQLGNITDWDKPANKSAAEIATGNNENERQGLIALMFQFGRYLLHSSSRKDSPLPAHLQGIWNDSVASRIGWTCDMHLDINTQMNYWPAELTALSESADPLLDWIENVLMPSGRITAKNCYGLEGWTAELVANAWGFSAPYWSPNLSPCPTGGAWLIQQLWHRYLYRRDDNELINRIMPILYEAALFLSQYLFEIPGNPYLQSGPSISPENSFTDGSGVYQASLSPVYEITVIRDIFTSYLQAVKLPTVISQKDKNYAALAEKIEEQIERLPPFRIADDGSLCEWSHDLPAVDSQHRHTSHLLGLYPYNQISPEKTPEFAAAAETSLVKRLTPAENWEDTGWSRSLLMLYSASLKKGDQAYEHIDSMLRYLLQPALLVKHPPTRGAPAFDDVYEMDGNTGLTTCIAHMLLQTSDDETIELLPALPAKWRDGQVRGLCASGRISVTIKWQSGRLVEAIISSDLDQKRVFSYRGRRQTIKLEADKPIRVVYE